MLRAACALSAAAAAAAAPSAADLRRARQRVPGAAFRGGDFAATNAALNAHLRRAGAAPLLRRCEEMGDGALRAAMRTLLAAREPALDAIYQERGDARALRHADAAGWEAEWAAAAASPHAAAARDAKCHDAVMVWTHHVPAASRAALAGGVTLPLLPAAAARRFDEADLPRVGGDAAAAAYVRATACAFCHGEPQPPQPATPLPGDAPKWPPASVPEWPMQFTALWYGWMQTKAVNMTGDFSYDFARNRMREDAKIVGVKTEMYWFGEPQPAGEQLPAGVSEGYQYRVTTVLGKKICSVSANPGMSVTRPDGFANGGRIAPERLVYVGREFIPEVGRWTDHWLFNDDPCGNFTVWNDIDTHYPVKSDGPLGCGTGKSASWWADVKVGAENIPADTWSDYDFTKCKQSNTSDYDTLPEAARQFLDRWANRRWI